MQEPNSPSDLPALVSKLFTLLEPLTPEVRTRVVSSAFSLLGSPPPPSTSPTPERAGSASAPSNWGRRATAWLSRYDVTVESLERLFHFDDGSAELIGEVPGDTKREQTINSYLLVGLRELMRNDEPKFSDEQAVELCRKVGCYDRPNHAVTRGHFGNRIAGSKDQGWSLTNPGLEAVALLVKTAT